MNEFDSVCAGTLQDTRDQSMVATADASLLRPEDRARTATILVVDDLAGNRRVLVELLKNEGHRLFEAADGRAGLDLVRAEHPDLVITDLLMPVMDGYEFVRQLRLDPVLRLTPVVFYSADYSRGEAHALAESAGASFILMKPANADQVLTVVNRALARDPDGAAPDRSTLTKIEFDRQHLRLLTDKLSEKTGDLRLANARLRALHNIGLELASETDPDRLLRNVCHAARDLFGATYVTLGIVELDGGTIQRVETCGIDPSPWFRKDDAIHGVLESVIGGRRVIRGSSPETALFPANHPEVQTFVAAPLASPTNVYGWFCLVGNEGRAFSDEDEDLVTILAGQVGRIYENSHLHALSQARAAALEHEVNQHRLAVTEKQQTAEALRIGQERTRFALESADIGIWDIDYATGAVQWSETIEAHYGLAPGTFPGTFDAFVERIHPDDRAATLQLLEEATRSGRDFTMQHRTVWADGTIRWLTGSGRIVSGPGGEPVRGIGISQDVTARHALEEQYQQMQKMEAVGRLAGGVAHDFNNLLTVILGYCELMLEDLPAGDVRRLDIEQIQTAGDSASSLTRQLLAFSRKQIIEPTVLDLNTVIANMRTMLGRLIGEDIKIVIALSREPATVVADCGQLEQIVLNLAVNARDAMPDGGTLTIGTAAVELDAEEVKAHALATPGMFHVITVDDTGTGMTPQVMARLFEPFFTTKDVGKGTGLGLASVHGMMTRSGGSIQAHSRPGHGSTFKAYFPATAGATASHVEHRATAALMVSIHTIMLVEDAEKLRHLTRRLLERMGHTVFVAANARDAIELFDHHDEIDVLITDVVMPGGSGPLLARQLIARRPALKVIYISGYTEETIAHHGVLNAGLLFLHKPFTSPQLGRKIREAFETAAA